mmetsp:Transcript_39152/g.124624  ORF Transcript_39152/g.124624 Transcript_39152/m.124624 type:complete len:192 (-) Transcript_39152:438-1013(-)
MHPKRGFGIADEVLRDCAVERHEPRLFAGVPIVVAGDFRQCLPVIRHGSRAQTVKACLNKSTMWPHFMVMRLSKNMRAARLEAEGRDPAAQADWASLLLKLGDGELGPDWEAPDDLLLSEDMTVQVRESISPPSTQNPNLHHVPSFFFSCFRVFTWIPPPRTSSTSRTGTGPAKGPGPMSSPTSTASTPTI